MSKKFDIEHLREIMRSCFSDATRRALWPAFMQDKIPTEVLPDSVLDFAIGIFAKEISKEIYAAEMAFMDKVAPMGISMSYICSECGEFAYGPEGCLSIDSGTTFTCEKCGKKTVVDLWKTGERKEFYVQRSEMSRLVRTLAKRLPSDDEWRLKALGYLERNGLMGNILRESVDMNDYDLELESTQETACGRAGRKHRMKRVSSGRVECIYPDCDAFYEG